MTYICLEHVGEEPICCEALDEPTVRINVLAVIYTNANGAGRPSGSMLVMVWWLVAESRT